MKIKKVWILYKKNRTITYTHFCIGKNERNCTFVGELN
ncbi:hypothetical protein AsAng_0032010 [Aureispira anguillae]|uniref:Uncharacterized protein n=1 Tax=Aureispira anguillae TaxID=2864201 RepID=A0A915YG23_9BACT|nr:hypothetical protein AsAng_0032010 [Aureispira anguillae]